MCSSNSFWGENSWWWIIILIIIILGWGGGFGGCGCNNYVSDCNNDCGCC